MYVDYSKFKKFEKALQRLGENREDEILTMDIILYLHKYAVTEFGSGDLAVRDQNLLESVVITPSQNVFGQDLYPTVFDKAAKYLLDFSRYQIFVDGNKRTGVLAMIQELAINGYDLKMSSEKLYETTLKIANNEITETSELAAILRENCVFLNMDEVLKYADKEDSEPGEEKE